MSDVTVTVARALSRDAGRRIARIPKAIREVAGLRPGGLVRVRAAERSLTLRVAVADRELVGSRSCRLDADTREQLRIQPGASVTLTASAAAPLVGAVNSDRYDLVVVERATANPFQISPRLMEITATLVASSRGEEATAKAIFEWVQRHVRYGSARRRGVGYRDSIEVKSDAEGVCGEQAYLYVSMARLAGLTSSFVRVKRDHRGAPVNHACASVMVDGTRVLADPAYHAFGIEHQDYEVMDDLRAHRLFVAMREGTPVWSNRVGSGTGGH